MSDNSLAHFQNDRMVDIQCDRVLRTMRCALNKAFGLFFLEVDHTILETQLCHGIFCDHPQQLIDGTCLQYQECKLVDHCEPVAQIGKSRIHPG